jgi:hypothetical protein
MPDPLATFLVACSAVLVLTPFGGRQDPPPATPPGPPAATTPAAKEVPGRPARHPFEGVYELRRRVVNGEPDGKPSKGLLAITQRHLFLQLAAPGPDPDLPLVRASARTWRPHEPNVATTIKLGWFSDASGGLHAEPPGSEEQRRIELVQGGVRVLQDDRNWLEFERVE